MEHTIPLGPATEDLLEIRLRPGIPALEQQAQAPTGVGHQVAGVDPDVFAAVLPHGVGIAPQVLEQNAEDLRRGQAGVEPKGHAVVVDPEGIAAVVPAWPREM